MFFWEEKGYMYLNMESGKNQKCYLPILTHVDLMDLQVPL